MYRIFIEVGNHVSGKDPRVTCIHTTVPGTKIFNVAIFMRMKPVSQHFPLKANWKTLYYVNYISDCVPACTYVQYMIYVWYYIRQLIRYPSHWPLNSYK